MTMPDERLRALIETKKFLEELSLSGGHSPRWVRTQAERLLRHYPQLPVLSLLCAALPAWFAEPRKPE
jgi:hypothetical protein